MRVGKINTNIINFKENTLSREMNSQDAILMLRDPKATIKFQQHQVYAQKADSVDSNPFVAIGYKLYRTFSLLKSNNDDQAESTKTNTIV